MSVSRTARELGDYCEQDFFVHVMKALKMLHRREHLKFDEGDVTYSRCGNQKQGTRSIFRCCSVRRFALAAHANITSGDAGSETKAFIRAI